MAEGFAELIDALRGVRGVSVDAAAEVVALAGLPRDLTELLTITRGIRHEALGYIDFTGGSRAVPFEEAFPTAIALADADGDAWVLDPGAQGDVSSIYFLSHDPPVIVRPFPTLHAFLAALASRDVVGEAHALAKRAWQQNATGVAAADAAHSDDPLLAAFAQRVPGDYRVHDLRGEGIGSFVWGRGKPPHTVVRDGSHPLFATEPPRPRRALGLVTRLFGSAGGG